MRLRRSAACTGPRQRGTALFKLGRTLGVVGAGAAGIDAGINKWYRDSERTDLSTTERVGRSVISGVTTAAGSFAGGYFGAQWGAAGGAAITGGNPAGAIAGGMIGAGLGG